MERKSKLLMTFVALFWVVLTSLYIVFQLPLVAISTIWLGSFLMLALFEYMRYSKYVHTKYAFKVETSIFAHAFIMSILAFCFFLYVLIAQYYTRRTYPLFFYIIPIVVLLILMFAAAKQDSRYELCEEVVHK